MRAWARYLVTGLAGTLLGTALAAYSVKAGVLGAAQRAGPWTTGSDFGSARADAYTRAVVALRGLLALPAGEARYYNAAVDDTGRPLDGRCRYLVRGGELSARWWSLTLYDPAGYLVPNRADIYSFGSMALSPGEARRWTVMVAPAPMPAHWIPTGRVARFELTLRTYLPTGAGQTGLPRARLPSITRVACA